MDKDQEAAQAAYSNAVEAIHIQLEDLPLIVALDVVLDVLASLEAESN